MESTSNSAEVKKKYSKLQIIQYYKNTVFFSGQAEECYAPFLLADKGNTSQGNTSCCEVCVFPRAKLSHC